MYIDIIHILTGLYRYTVVQLQVGTDTTVGQLSVCSSGWCVPYSLQVPNDLSIKRGKHGNTCYLYSLSVPLTKISTLKLTGMHEHKGPVWVGTAHPALPSRVLNVTSVT